MTDEIGKLQSILGESVELINSRLEQARTEPLLEVLNDSLPLGIVNANSLLDQCKAICDEYHADKKPLLRTIHHLACSGGTLISKCVSAMPNVFVLSEVHPDSPTYPPEGPARFMPTDIAGLAKHARFPELSLLSESIVRDSIVSAHQHLLARGGTLVVRDHAHSDFCHGEKPGHGSRLIELLEPHFEMISIITLRNPIDSYVSLKRNGWLHFSPPTFEEYCRRTIAFIDAFPNVHIVLYEEFVQEPQRVMKNICSGLRIPFHELFEYTFETSNMTGDSGRSSASISPRPRRELAREFLEEISSSESFQKLAGRFDTFAI